MLIKKGSQETRAAGVQASHKRSVCEEAYFPRGTVARSPAVGVVLWPQPCAERRWVRMGKQCSNMCALSPSPLLFTQQCSAAGCRCVLQSPSLPALPPASATAATWKWTVAAWASPPSPQTSPRTPGPSSFSTTNSASCRAQCFPTSLPCRGWIYPTTSWTSSLRTSSATWGT